MNSLEKLINNLEDSKTIVLRQLDKDLAQFGEDIPTIPSRDEWLFAADAIQGAINRLQALVEEEGLGE